MTLKKKLVLSMVALALLPLLVCSVLTYTYVARVSEQEAVLTSQRLIAYKVDAYQRLIDNLFNSLLDMVSFPDLVTLSRDWDSGSQGIHYTPEEEGSFIRQYERVEAKILSFYTANRSILEAVGVFSRTGNAPFYTWGDLKYSEEMLEEVKQRAGKPLWHVDFEHLRPDGSLPITLSCAYLNGVDDQVMGLIMMTLDRRALQELFTPEGLREGELYFILDEQDRVLMHPDAARVGQRFDDPAFLRSLDQTGEGTQVLPLWGEDHIVSVAQTPYTGWRLFYVRPYRYISQISEGIFSIFAGVVVVCGVLALGLAVALTLSIYRPIRRLCAAMGRVDRRNRLDVRAPETGSPELRALAESFNGLMERVGQLVEQIEQESAQKKQAEMAALRAQINPHFLYNTLNVIKCLAAAGDTDNCQKAAVALIALLRASIGHNREVVTLQEEIAHVDNYLMLQRLRLDVQFEYRCQIPEALYGLHVPRFLLQPVVENALVHAFSAAQAHNVIRVDAWRDGEELLIEVRDNGQGMDGAKLEQLERQMREHAPYNFGKVGLLNINERIKDQFGERYGLHLVGQPQGLLVRIFLPAIRE